MEENPMEMQFPVILDGATGTELQKRGFTGDLEWHTRVVIRKSTGMFQRSLVS